MKSQTAIAEIFLNGSFMLLSLMFADIAFGIPPGGETAIKGYDIVSYFRAGKALKGSESLTFRWHDMTWHFSSKENLELFAENPEKYAPQYDGWCAWAMTESRLAVTDPEIWKIVDDKLYLNCSRTAYEKWSRDIPGHIRKADAVWKEKFGRK